MKIRTAGPDDADVLVEMILELAAYEKLTHEARPDAAALRTHLAPDAQPRCHALLAHVDGADAPVGFALYFFNYSTFLTRWGVHLEDLYVRPAYRGRGVGFALFERVARTTVAGGGRRLEWAVLDWNTPALDFYRRLGAEPLDDWTTMRLSGDALLEIGA